MPDRIDKLLHIASKLSSAGLLEQARNAYTKAIEHNPGSATAWLELGNIQVKLRCLDDAATAYRKIIELAPNQATPHLLLGKVVHVQGKYEESLICLQQAIDLQPELLEANYLLGITHVRHGDPEKGLKCLEKVWQLSPDFFDIWYRYGFALAMQNNYSSAIPLFQRGLEISPECRIQLDTFTPIPTNSHSTNNTITIATSIAPGNIENQRKAIDSWKAQGFNVISVNSQIEINQLQADFSDVEFCKTERNAQKEYGKPYVYFDDALHFLDETGSGICGLVNSDIHFLDNRLKSFVTQQAKDSFLFGCRVDIPSLDQLTGRLFRFGYDYYFFDRKYLSMYPQEKFCLGLPWWDYWASLVPVLRNVPIKKLITPVAFHVAHKINWGSNNSWYNYARRITEYVGATNTPTEDTTNYYVNYVWMLIENHCTNISIPER